MDEWITLNFIGNQDMLTEVIFCLHAIFVAADYLAPSVLPILLTLLAIDVFLCNFAHHSILMYGIVSSLLHTLPPLLLKSASYSFIAICVDYLLV